jgi:fimbrial isopeptide formation D2 family protein/LPXTG-motif cell wall-anchored protein
MKSKTQMKKMTAVSCIMMALIMILTMLPITRAYATSAHEYEIFQIFTGNVGTDQTVGNLVWGYSGKIGDDPATPGESIPAEVTTALAALQGNTNKTDAEKVDEIKVYANLQKPLPKTSGDTTNYKLEQDEDTGAWVYTGLEPGYYLVRDTNNTQQSVGDSYTLYLIEVTDGTLTVNPKSSIPTVNKYIVDNGLQTYNAASIGEDVDYQITATVPENINDYKTYYMQFSDKLSKGLTFKADTVKVYFNSVNAANDITAYFHIASSKDAKTNETNIKVTIGDLKALKNISGKNYTFTGAETKIILTYSATLNENAVINGANPNDVKLIYENDPNESGTASTEEPETYNHDDPENPGDEPEKPGHTGETAEYEVATYTTQFTVEKVDGNMKALSGAEFTLTGDGVKTVITCTSTYTSSEEGTYYKLKDGTYTNEAPNADNTEKYADTETKYTVTVNTVVKKVATGSTSVSAEVGEDGYVTFQGLGDGQYTLKETKTPAGYNTASDVTFDIQFNTATKAFTCTDSNVTVADDGSMSLRVVNLKGSTLPQTGGIGTTIFYVVGTILVLGAAVVLITRKRMSAEEE